ncbi:AAA domain-containing protein [Aspergillus pseudocaelatus]|uniref:AAA domain-containing protein n=1 Tax=Aspergillus pseudocaelatus TaxID=1825620 RepID=A0ABQ6X382_9EURO|nr:AAA domain-containing protein [Aspergillus pseudocaelatus]
MAEAAEVKEDNKDLTQDNMIALASTRSPDWHHFHGPRERWIRFKVPSESSSSSSFTEPNFLPAKSTFTHGDTAVCFRISDRPIAGKLAFQAFVTRSKSPMKKELHPENVAHSARLEFNLHPFVDRRIQRCVQNFSYTEHLPTKPKEGDEADKGSKVEYIAPCYIDIEFDTTGGISQGLSDGHEFNREINELFVYMYSLTRNASTKPRTVNLRVDIDPRDVSRLTGFLETLKDIANLHPTSAAWSPYRAHGGEVRILFGQQKPRVIVHQGWGSDMVKFRGQSHFYDIDAYLVKMAYGAVLEWRRPYEMIKRIQLIPASIKLKRIGESIVAIAMLDRYAFKEDLLPPEMKGMELILPEFTEVEVIVRVPQGSGPTMEWKGSGFTVPGYIEDEDPSAIQILLYGPRLGKLLNTDQDSAIVEHPVSLKFEINKAPIRRSINALAKLKANENEVARWFPLLLNHEPNALPDVDLLHGIDPNVIQSALRHLLQLKQWNADKVAAFRSVRNTKAGCSLLEGFPGCGKTTVLAAIAIFLHLCGFDILLVGPSNAAVDALTREFKELAPEVEYVRVRRGEVEKRSRTTANPRESADEEHAEVERHSALMGLIMTMKESRSRKVEGDLEQSVLTYVHWKCNTVYAAGKEFVLNVAISAPKKQVTAPGNAEPDYTEDLQDAYSVVREYLSQPKVPRPKDASCENLEKWSKRETAFKKSYDAVSELIIQEARVVACTNILAGTDLVRRNFGTKGKGIIIIADEDGQATEPDAIVPLVSLDNADKVIGMIRGGDRHQLPPLVITVNESPGYNEFGAQIGKSLFDRLRCARFPVAIVCQQHRMRPSLSKFPSDFTYEGKMTNDPSVEAITLNPVFSQKLLVWLKLQANDVEFRNEIELIGLDVSDGNSVTNPTTYSRSNVRNVAVVMDLIEYLITENALSGLSCCILPTYADQKKAYINSMLNLSRKLSIAWEDMVSVFTVDGMQGNQADIVIVDWVVTFGEPSDLGFASDNRRANVALTRARACLIVVANGQIINNNRLDGDEARMKVPPEILVHWKHLLDNDLVVPCAGALRDIVEVDEKADVPKADNTIQNGSAAKAPSELVTMTS